MVMSQSDSPADAPLCYLFMIIAGVTHSPEELEPTCRLLSRRFTGEIWSFGSNDADVVFDRMRLRVVKDRSRSSLLNFGNFAHRVLAHARDLRPAPPGRIVVTSYDPFKGGLLALCVARILEARLMCEVNGAFANRDNFAHLRPGLWRRLRALQARVIGSYVLHRANSVRLLFPGQLEGFVRLPPRIIVRQFFALTYTERFYPGPEEPIIVAVGFPFARKGIDVLASAFQRVAPRHPDWRLVLIGHGIPDELRARGMEHPQITALPGLPQSELAQWVSRCAILALASRSEAMGRVLLEAAAAGKCRLATRVDGIPTVVEDGVDGFLVDKEDIGQLAAYVEKLIGDRDLRRSMGEAARARVQSEFSPAAYLARFEELIVATLCAPATAVRLPAQSAEHTQS